MLLAWPRLALLLEPLPRVALPLPVLPQLLAWLLLLLPAWLQVSLPPLWLQVSLLPLWLQVSLLALLPLAWPLLL
ncbi:hypothetical protein [Janthinobacterium psychrotolerans]|uniref:hypothetical protein n=1 Tax=Janthinobacterium psychrotolerans TaxID=1747903 RepID=UPI0008067818|nr:hypothetical protein [Janthinobacterium psychrotolerans]